MQKKNDISNRVYCLSPAVESGRDRECTNKDFYQPDNEELVDIGKLGYGSRVNHRETNLPYIILNFEKGQTIKPKVQQKINSTIELMYQSTSPYLFRLLNHFEDDDNVYLIFEPYDGKTLKEKLTDQGPFNAHTSLKYIKEAALGIKTLHSNKMFNITVLPETILIGECLKLTDYGLKMSVKNMSKKPLRTTFYIKKGQSNYPITAYTSPEELEGLKKKSKPILDSKTDSWNLGILLYEMLTKFKSPFKGDTIEELINNILTAEPDLSIIEDELCRLLLEKLLKKNPQERIDINDMLLIDSINSIDIEEPVIDLNDNIMNPNSQEREEYIPNVQQGAYEFDSSMAESIKFENENLKKKIERLQKMNAKLEGAPRSTYKQKKHHINQVSSANFMDEDISNPKESINILSEQDLENKEKKLDELIKKEGGDLAQIEDTEKDEEISDLEDDIDKLGIQNKLLKLKYKYSRLKDKVTKIKKKQKKYEVKIAKLKEEKNELLDKKRKNEENEKQQTQKKNQKISEMKEALNKKIEDFTAKDKTFRELVETLITLSKEDYGKEVEEHKKVIEDNMKQFNEKKEEVKKILNEKAKSSTSTIQKETKPNPLADTVQENKKKINELMEFKRNFDQAKIQETTYTSQINQIKEKIEIDKENMELYKYRMEQIRNYLNTIDEEKCNVQNLINSTKTFIEKHFSNLAIEFDNEIINNPDA